MAGCGERGENLISERLRQLAVVGKGKSQKCKKEKKRRSPACLLYYLLASAGPCTVFFWASFFFHSSLGCQPRLVPSSSVVGMWQRQCSLLYGTEFRHLPWLGAGGGGRETCQVHPNPRSSRDYPCSAGLTGALAGDLRVQSKRQEQSKVKPFRRAMEKQPETAWP